MRTPSTKYRLAAVVAGMMLACSTVAAQAQEARNIILFLGDAGGVPTLSAGGIMAHDRPQSLFLHSMPNVGLSDTSALNNWVTDSGAGMTAIMVDQEVQDAFRAFCELVQAVRSLPDRPLDITSGCGRRAGPDR